MTRKIVGGIKDEKGAFIRLPRKETDTPTLDEIGQTIIFALGRATDILSKMINEECDVSRETMGSLRDCEAIHRELYKKEKELLESLTDEDLDKLLK